MRWRLNWRQVNLCSLLSKQEKALQTLHFPHAQHLDRYSYALLAPLKEEQTKDICLAILQFVAYCSELKWNNQIRNGKHPARAVLMVALKPKAEFLCHCRVCVPWQG